MAVWIWNSIYIYIYSIDAFGGKNPLLSSSCHTCLGRYAFAMFEHDLLWAIKIRNTRDLSKDIFCFLGLGEGVTFPVMHAMLAEWSPPLERSRLSTYVYSGATIGTVISMSVTGEICERLGWESVFYIFGGMGIIWFIFWSFLAYEDPSRYCYLRNSLSFKIISHYKIKVVSKHILYLR